MRKIDGGKTSNQILLSMGSAVIFGLAINYLGHKYGFITQYQLLEKYLIIPIGEVFLRLLFMSVLPIVFLAIIGGMIELGQDKGKLKRVSLKAGLYFFFTTLCAIIIGLTLAIIIKPGLLGNMEAEINLSKSVASVNIVDVLLNIFPKNPFAAFAEANMPQIMFFAVFFGIAIVIVGRDRAKEASKVVNYLMDIVTEIIKIVMIIAPIGVFCLLLRAIATQGYSTIISLLLYVITILLGLILQFTLVYCPILFIIARITPLKFIMKMMDVSVVAFATSSSKATLPVAIETCEEKLGVNKEFVRFILPLGASINMNGAAIMQSVALIFIAQIYHVHLSFSIFCTLVFTSILPSAGSAGIPGGAIIMLATILLAAGIPTEGIALILGVDRILDMCRTVVNISGDVVCAIAIAKSENAIDKKVLLS